ncbi:MAG: ABC transporter substrate-binding protein [Candidatus Tectomicrobia bacterium]|uniref:ABC transporter substrate-binding protein n=1 Tax=Tectimicrobiota bacterium TaxID=2528274 RepID=A0A938B4D0_UNCTE|nr:ABC transporter substrate-binding protein [Candidatus Tectomicrobia bacterium]
MLSRLLSLCFGCLVLAWTAAIAAQDQKGTLIIALDTLGAQTMDPILEARAPHTHYQAPVFDSIVGFNYEKGGIGPGVAERWEMAPDGSHWTFYVRPGQKWHNGDPVTAEDVKFSLERTMSPESVSSSAAALRRNIQRIEVVNNQTVRVYTNGILPYFPESLSRAVFQEGQLMPKKYLETAGPEVFRKKPIGSGPWKFVRSVPGDRVEYEAVDYPHWRGTPHFKKMVIVLVPEESTRVAMVRTGEAHIASISPESIREVEKANMRVVSVPGTMQALFQFYGLYTPEFQQSPLTDVRVREAMSLAINRQQLIDHVMYGKATLPLPLSIFRYSVDIDIKRWETWSREALRYDPERAKQLLTDAGHPNGFAMTFVNTALPGTPFMTQIGEAVADFWSKIGIQVTIKNIEWGSYQPMMRGEQKGLAGTVSMFRAAGRPVAESRYHSGLAGKSEGHLFGEERHCATTCQEFERLHHAVITERDEAKRIEHTNRMIDFVAQTWIVVPILEGMGYWAINPKHVGAFRPLPGRHELGDVFERIPRSEQKSWQ